MTKILLRIEKIIKFIITSPIWALCLVAVYLSKNKKIIWSDLKRYSEYHNGIWSRSKTLILRLLFSEKAYRNVFYYRINPIVASCLRFFLNENQTLHITTRDIGEGLLVVHGDSTYINASSIGKNLYVNQCVTIGVIGTSAPKIGNDVRIATGSIVIGGITIGNNVTIGAGSVVVKNIPDNCTVVGNPAKIVKLNNNKVNIPL